MAEQQDTVCALLEASAHLTPLCPPPCHPEQVSPRLARPPARPCFLRTSRRRRRCPTARLVRTRHDTPPRLPQQRQLARRPSLGVVCGGCATPTFRSCSGSDWLDSFLRGGAHNAATGAHSASRPRSSAGAIMTLSQTPCIGSAPGVGGACCNSQNTTCSNWAGSHLVSLGCIQVSAEKTPPIIVPPRPCCIHSEAPTNESDL